MREICTSGSVRGGGSVEGMGSLNGHEAGNGGHGHGEPTATRSPRLLDHFRSGTPGNWGGSDIAGT